MIKNIVIGFLSILLITAGIFILNDRRQNRQNARELSNSVMTENTDSENTKDTPKPETTAQTKKKTPQELIVGGWQSTDDSQSIITFESNGEVTDVYGGGVVHEAGTYQIFENQESLPRNLLPVQGDLFLRESFGKEDYYYTISELNSGILRLLYISGNGSILNYRRLK